MTANEKLPFPRKREACEKASTVETGGVTVSSSQRQTAAKVP